MENWPGLKMYFLLNMGIFHCYVSLPEGISFVGINRPAWSLFEGILIGIRKLSFPQLPERDPTSVWSLEHTFNRGNENGPKNLDVLDVEIENDLGSSKRNSSS